jgi:hypothetical protein
VAAQAERRTAAQEAQSAMAQLRQEAASQLQRALEEAEERERLLRYLHSSQHLLKQVLA